MTNDPRARIPGREHLSRMSSGSKTRELRFHSFGRARLTWAHFELLPTR